MAGGLLLSLVIFSTGDLEAVRAAFELSDCKKVIEQREAALRVSRSRTGRGEIYRLAAICYFRLGQQSLADTQARASLRLAPVTGLDPFLSPPKERSWFDALVREVPPPKPQVVERVVTVTATQRRQRCFVPLGYCHWRFGDYGRGAGFAVAEGLGLAVNVFALCGNMLSLCVAMSFSHTVRWDTVRPVWQRLWLAAACCGSSPQIVAARLELKHILI